MVQGLFIIAEDERFTAVDLRYELEEVVGVAVIVVNQQCAKLCFPMPAAAIVICLIKST